MSDFALFEDALWFEGEDHVYDQLAALCHPQRKPRPPLWWRTHPTLGVWADPSWREIKQEPALIGYASLTLGPGAAWWWDLAVHPDWRGKGLGRALFAQRLLICEAFGAQLVTGQCATNNEPMIRLFREAGMLEGDTILGAYLAEQSDGPMSHDAIVWGGGEPSFAWAHTIKPWEAPHG